MVIEVLDYGYKHTFLDFDLFDKRLPGHHLDAREARVRINFDPATIVSNN